MTNIFNELRNVHLSDNKDYNEGFNTAIKLIEVLLSNETDVIDELKDEILRMKSRISMLEQSRHIVYYQPYTQPTPIYTCDDHSIPYRTKITCSSGSVSTKQ